MAMTDAIKHVIDAMKKKIVDVSDYDQMETEEIQDIIKSFIFSLEIILKLEENTIKTPIVSNRDEIEKAKAEFRKKVDEEESTEGNKLVALFDTPDDDSDITTMTEVPNSMPIGARTFVGKHVYELKVDGLHYINTPPQAVQLHV
jgi:hypothetical protein